MIKINDTRYKDREMFSSDRELTVSGALTTLLKFEVGYGGKIVDISDTKVVVKTYIMSCVDVTTFTGNKDEMALLVESACVAAFTDPMAKDSPSEYKDLAIDRVMDVTKGVPLLIKLSSGLLTGNFNAAIALLYLIGSGDVAKVKELSKMNIDTLLAVCTLVRLDNVDLRDAIELAMLEPQYDNAGKICGLAIPAE